MPFKKGRTKTGGRTKGTANKLNATVKSRIEEIIDDGFDRFIDDLDAMEPRERTAVFLKLLEYILPKQRQVEQKVNINDLTDPEVEALLDRIAQKIE